MRKGASRSFGYKCGWFAIKSTSIHRVAKQVLERPIEVEWDAGCDEAYRGSHFVTPPTGGWVLVASNEYLHDGVADITEALEKLSRAFGAAQFFATDRVVGLLCYARARKGKIERAFYEVDGKQEVNEGAVVPDERAAFGQGHDEGGLMELAARWSVDPTQITRHRKGLVSGPPPEPEPVRPRVPGPRRLEVGERAPAFRLQTSRLSDYAGRPVVLFFYPGCKSESWISATNVANALHQGRTKLAKFDAVVLGICDDTNEDNRTRHEIAVDFPCLLDRSRKTIDAYGAWGDSQPYETTETGVVQSLVLVGRDGMVAEVERYEGFVDPVLAKLVVDNLVARVKKMSKLERPARAGARAPRSRARSARPRS